MTKKAFVITVDGPSGAGKGTLCQRLAQTLGYPLLDSGALYRLTALAAFNQKVASDDVEKLTEVAANLDVAFTASADGGKVELEGKDVTREIRREAIGMMASKVAAIPEVRTALLQRQREFANDVPGLIADGRDMGTVVFPTALAKFFLTANAEERALRRVRQLEQAGESSDYNQILADIEARDERDSCRAAAPLVAASDALELDSTAMSIEEVVKAAIHHIAQIQSQSAES